MTSRQVQPSAAPTRKVFWGAVSGLVTGFAMTFLGDIADKSPALAEYADQLRVFVPVAVAYGVSYFTADSALAGEK